MAKIKTFEEACAKLKLDPKKVLPKVSGMPEIHRKSLIAHAKLILIAQALNGTWKPNYKNSSQLKYEPYFWMNDPENGFSSLLRRQLGRQFVCRFPPLLQNA